MKNICFQESMCEKIRSNHHTILFPKSTRRKYAINAKRLYPFLRVEALLNDYSLQNSTMSFGVHSKTMHSFSNVFMVMDLLRRRLVIVYALKPCLYIRV